MNVIKKLNKLLKRESYWEYCYRQGFRCGKNFQCNSEYPIDANFPWLISVGNDVTIADGVRILAHDASTVKVGAHSKIGIVQIGNNVFIGAGVIVLCDTRIGDNVIIGAGSVVTHDIPSNSVFAGNPAKYICSFEEYQLKNRNYLQTHLYFNEFSWSEWSKQSDSKKKQMREKLKKTFGYV